VSDKTCAGCHGETQPHGDQFAGRGCDDCHSVETFRISSFDHDRTSYPLDGAHRDVPCASCHRAEKVSGRTEPVVHYRPLETECRSCHEGER